MKKKTTGDIIILHMCTKNYDEMMYSSWDMVHDGRTDWRKKWHEVGTPPKKRDSPFSSLKDTVQFSVDVLDCEPLQQVSTSGEISHWRTDEMIDAIYSLVILGIYGEMIGDLEIDEDIVFSDLMDLQSKVKKI